MVMSAGIKGAWREGPCCQETMPFAYSTYATPCTLTYALDSQEDGPSGSDPCKWVRQRVDVDRGSMVVTR
jgi:hypothetical protein